MRLGIGPALSPSWPLQQASKTSGTATSFPAGSADEDETQKRRPYRQQGTPTSLQGAAHGGEAGAAAAALHASKREGPATARPEFSGSQAFGGTQRCEAGPGLKLQGDLEVFEGVQGSVGCLDFFGALTWSSWKRAWHEKGAPERRLQTEQWQ